MNNKNNNNLCTFYLRNRKSNLPLATNRMSCIPQPSSVLRPTSRARPSHLMRPLSATRSSSATRASSAKRTNQEMRDTFGRPSSGGLRRYGSDSYLNTPNRFTMSTPMGCSPAVRHSVVPESSRKTKHENIMKVQDILQSDAAFYGDLNLKNDCLKSMTTNQFHMIVNHFARLICGKGLDAFIQNGDLLQGILNFMNQLQYPYTINKSMLKTPNAPHTFDHVVVMLLWLGEGSNVSHYASDDAFINKCLVKQNSEFPNEEFTAMFSNAIQEGYVLWNGESDEHSMFVDQLTDGMIGAKMGHKVSSIADLNTLAERLNVKSKELTDNPVQLENVHYFEQLESKYVEYETKEDDLINQLKVNRDRLAAVKVNWTDKRTKMQASTDKMNELADQIRNQKYSIYEYKKLSQEMSSLRSSVDSVRAEVKLAQDDQSNQLVTQARLVKKLSEAITAINHHGLQVCKIINDSQLEIGEKELKKLHLPPNPTLHQVETVKQMLSHIFSAVKGEKHNAQLKLQEVSAELNVLKAKATILNKDYENKLKMLKDASAEGEVLNKTHFMKNRKNHNYTQEWIKKTDDKKATIDRLKRDIASEEQRKAQLEEENVKLMKNGEEQAAKIIEEKQRICNAFDEAEKTLDKVLQDFNYPT